MKHRGSFPYKMDAPGSPSVRPSIRLLDGV